MGPTLASQKMSGSSGSTIPAYDGKGEETYQGIDCSTRINSGIKDICINKQNKLETLRIYRNLDDHYKWKLHFILIYFETIITI